MRSEFKLISVSILFIFFVCNLVKAQNKIDVLVVGTIHGKHAVSNYTYNVVLGILDTYKPDMICVEIRPEDFRNNVPYLREMTLATFYGDLNGIKVEPIDWYDDNNNDRTIRDSLSKTDHYAQLMAKEDSLLKNDSSIKEFNNKYGENIYNNNKLDLMFWNGEDYSNYNWSNYKISLDVYGDSPFNLHYITRNRNMLHLINNSISRNNPKRIIILTGAEHKRFFDDSLGVKQNVRLLSIEDILPLTKFDNTKLAADEIPSLYFQKKVSNEDKEEFYSAEVLPLVHGSNMDFQPSLITENSINEYKYILDNWSREIPNSERLIYENGWYNFLANDYDKAIKLFNQYIEKLESSQQDKELPFDKGITYSVIGKCYDVLGNRSRALEYYNKAIPEFNRKNKEWLCDYVITPYLKDPYKR